jgi:hypothetical protein
MKPAILRLGRQSGTPKAGRGASDSSRKAVPIKGGTASLVCVWQGDLAFSTHRAGVAQSLQWSGQGLVEQRVDICSQTEVSRTGRSIRG